MDAKRLLLNKPGARRVLQALSAVPALTGQALARRGAHPGTLASTLATTMGSLVGAGLVQMEIEADRVGDRCYSLTAMGRAWAAAAAAVDWTRPAAAHRRKAERDHRRRQPPGLARASWEKALLHLAQGPSLCGPMAEAGLGRRAASPGVAGRVGKILGNYLVSKGLASAGVRRCRAEGKNRPVFLITSAGRRHLVDRGLGTF